MFTYIWELHKQQQAVTVVTAIPIFFKSLCLYSLNRGKDINKCDDDVLVHGKKFKSGEGTSNEFFIYSMFIHAQKLILLNMYGNF